jgi:hypothetical protein
VAILHSVTDLGGEGRRNLSQAFYARSDPGLPWRPGLTREGREGAGVPGRARGGPSGGKGLSGERARLVPGVELAAVGEGAHVVVAHEVAAAHSARALFRHEAPLDLQFGVRAQTRHGRRLPGHPKQQQEQWRRQRSPAPRPERHRSSEKRSKGARGAWAA